MEWLHLRVYRPGVFVNLDEGARAFSGKATDEDDIGAIPRRAEDQGTGSPNFNAGETAFPIRPVFYPVPSGRRVENELPAAFHSGPGAQPE
jgi:hypothetical protein